MYWPGRHRGGSALARPAAQYLPGDDTHAPVHDGDVKPGDAPYVPGGQGVHAVTPGPPSEYDPALQTAPVGDIMPEPQNEPAEDVHGPEQALLVKLVVSPYVPAERSDKSRKQSVRERQRE